METIISPILLIKDIPEQDELNLQILSSSEKQRLLSFKDEQRKKQFYWGRFFLKQTLAQIFSCTLPEIEIQVNPIGKLFLDNKNVHVSLSHSFHKIAIMVSNSPCGIDIEKKVASKEIDKIFEKVFKNSIRANWTNEEEKVSEFFRLWTLKEAEFKLGLDESQRKNLSSQTLHIDDFIASYVYIM